MRETSTRMERLGPLIDTDSGELPEGASGERRAIAVSIVVPLLDEAENVDALCSEIREAMDASGLDYEVIFVDDGSRDGTKARLARAVDGDPRVTVVELTRRFGQTAALASGFRMARGEVVVAMDGDLQNDPADIPRLVAKIHEPPGYDVVSGWRKHRKDPFFTRRLPSALANLLIRKLTWTREVHDFGCTLKAYRREALEDVRLYGEMHRFLPAICKWQGAKITEVVVNHRPRHSGKSKYGLRRAVKVLFDLITVKFLGDYLAKPLYFFGKIALVSLAASLVSLGVAVAQKFGYLTAADRLPLHRNVLVLLATMLFLTSVMLVMMGVVSELLVRIYHESQGSAPYKVRRIYRGKDGESG